MATPVPLNFMWADESVLLEDIQKGISEGMVKWATEFYKNKSVDKLFELDVNPSYPLTMKSASKFLLTKNSGVRPDLRSYAEMAPAEWREYERLKKLIQETKKEEKELRKREDLYLQLINALERERDELYERRDNTTNAQEIAQINAELSRTRQDKNTTMASWRRITEAIRSSHEALDNLYIKRSDVIDKIVEKMSEPSGDRMFRLQMALRYALDGIGSESRINVIFCKAKISTEKFPTVAETRGALDKPIQVLPGQFLLWPYQYIVINLIPGRRKALAHEVVHLSGRSHPDAKVVFKGIKKVPLLGIGVPDFEEVPGGFFDGPENDIMYYKRTDPEAKDTTMNILDQVDLRNFLLRLAGKPWSLAGTP
jgi:hypothetical protein